MNLIMKFYCGKLKHYIIHLMLMKMIIITWSQVIDMEIKYEYLLKVSISQILNIQLIYKLLYKNYKIKIYNFQKKKNFTNIKNLKIFLCNYKFFLILTQV